MSIETKARLAPRTPHPTDRMVRLPEVLQLVQISRSTLRRLVAEGSFPRPVQLGARSVAWRLRELENYLARRPAVGSAPAPREEADVPEARRGG
jgi:prophage regulatory protein